MNFWALNGIKTIYKLAKVGVKFSIHPFQPLPYYINIDLGMCIRKRKLHLFSSSSSRRKGEREQCGSSEWVSSSKRMCANIYLSERGKLFREIYKSTNFHFND